MSLRVKLAQSSNFKPDNDTPFMFMQANDMNMSFNPFSAAHNVNLRDLMNDDDSEDDEHQIEEVD